MAAVRRSGRAHASAKPVGLKDRFVTDEKSAQGRELPSSLNQSRPSCRKGTGILRSMTAPPYTFDFGAVAPEELAQLFRTVGWGDDPVEVLAKSLAAYPCIVHTRSEHGQLVGYASAFSDGALSTMLGELIVHPSHRRRGIASRLLRMVEERYPGVPIYVKALGEAKHFFLARGYKLPRVEMTVLFRRPTSTGC